MRGAFAREFERQPAGKQDAVGDATGRTTRITVLDVGQGDAILLETRTGARMLVDGGPDPSRVLVALDERMVIALPPSVTDVGAAARGGRVPTAASDRPHGPPAGGRLRRPTATR